MVLIYDYFDYRKLLKDLFEEQKLKNKHFSYRILGDIVGFTSAGFFTKILQGTVNISPKNALSFAKAFHLSKLETRYFEQLVLFNQAKTHEERRYYFEQLIAARRTKIKTITDIQYELFSEWYYVAIRELLDFYPFYGDYKELSSLLMPNIQPGEAKKAVETLERLDLIHKHPDGYYEKTEQVLSTGESWMSIAITNFQMKTAELAKDAIQNYPKEIREFSTLTLSISQETFESIRERVKCFRQELLQIAKQDTQADRVYHLNVHLFPFTLPQRDLACEAQESVAQDNNEELTNDNSYQSNEQETV